MTNGNAAGAHVARQSRETQTPTDVAAHVNNQTVTPACFEIFNRRVQRFRKSHSKGTWKIRYSQKPDAGATMECAKLLGSTRGGRCFVPFLEGTSTSNSLSCRRRKLDTTIVPFALMAPASYIYGAGLCGI